MIKPEEVYCEIQGRSKVNASFETIDDLADVSESQLFVAATEDRPDTEVSFVNNYVHTIDILLPTHETAPQYSKF